MGDCLKNMMVSFAVFACIFTLVAPSFTSEKFEKQQRMYVERLVEMYMKNATFARDFDRTFGPQQSKQPMASFPCGPLRPSDDVPTSVHTLKPGDIKVVAGIGDSLTAGRGAGGGVAGLLTDYRGLSWSVGGDGDFSDTRTLPNILRQYNPNVYGFSVGKGTKRQGLNVAVSGSEARDIMEQAEELVSLLRNSKEVDMEKDWKVITLFIGANDLCDFCDDEEVFTAEKYEGHLTATLDYLQENVPRAFVNLVEVLNVEIVQELSDNILCTLVHAAVCNCAANPKKPDGEKKLKELRHAYQQVARDVASSGRYDTKDDFTVVLQPFYRDTFLPRLSNGEVDMSYFASDCFHHSKKGQQAAAEALWNNMIEPVGSKRLKWMPGEEIECPTEAHPYFFTSKNSKFASMK